MGATVAPVVRRPNPTAVGVAIWLASEVMFFGGLFAAYFTVKAANDEWPPAGVELDTPRAGIFTLVLVASSFTLHRAERGSHAEIRNWTLLTLALGVVFLGNQALEWATNDFTVSTDAFGTLYYALTGFHGLHVAVGLVLLAVVGLRPVGVTGSVPGLQRATTWYWHFVDVVWVLLFATIFLIR
jgi:cytochrome c oxidase subunit 3